MDDAEANNAVDGEADYEDDAVGHITAAGDCVVEGIDHQGGLHAGIDAVANDQIGPDIF